MRKDLEVASEDSRRLTDKLFRLEEDNRQLEATVSRLGGQDARRLKAQVNNMNAIITFTNREIAPFLTVVLQYSNSPRHIRT